MSCRAETCCDEALNYRADAPRADVVDRIVFANIGDFGTDEDNPHSFAVSELVKSWSPEYITTNGDNWYGAVSSLDNWEGAAGKLYRDYVYPYQSARGLTSTATANNFYACTGNHDRDPLGHKTSFAYWNYPEVFRNGAWGPSTGYYEVRRGFVHHFFFDTGYTGIQVNDQADGNDVNTPQGIWLRTQLAASDATWKIVHMHHPGYTSCPTTAGEPTLVGNGYLAYKAARNIMDQLQAWGAHVCLVGHVHGYERMDLNGFPIIINGVGGRTLASFTTPIEESVFRHLGFGAIKGCATCEYLRLCFFTVEGVLMDTLTLGRAGETDCCEDSATSSGGTGGTGSCADCPQTHFGAFTNPNGHVTGKVGDSYKSVESAGGDGMLWFKTSGTNTNTGWE